MRHETSQITCEQPRQCWGCGFPIYAGSQCYEADLDIDHIWFHPKCLQIMEAWNVHKFDSHTPGENGPWPGDQVEPDWTEWQVGDMARNCNGKHIFKIQEGDMACREMLWECGVRRIRSETKWVEGEQ